MAKIFKKGFSSENTSKPKSDKDKAFSPKGKSFAKKTKPFSDKPRFEKKSEDKEEKRGLTLPSYPQKAKNPDAKASGTYKKSRSFTKNKALRATAPKEKKSGLFHPDKKKSSTSWDKPKFGDKKSFGEKKSFGDKKTFGDKKKFGDKDFKSPSKNFKKNPEERVKSKLEKNKKFESKEAGPTPTYRITKEKTKAVSAEKIGDTTRLNKYVSNSGVCSRRDADIMIASGMVKVNGAVITEMGYQVKTGDVVKYENKILNPEKFVYILMNKPKDFITTMDDPDERKTVMDIIKNACKERVYPVGRLDRNTTGLLLLTNDGSLAAKLTHPSNEISKMYQADLDKPLSEEDFEKIVKGLTLEDGPVKVDDIAIVSPDRMSIGLEIHEGRNRIVRRIFEHLSYEVVRLDRVMYAGLSKKDLARGQWRFLTDREVIQLKHFK